MTTRRSLAGGAVLALLGTGTAAASEGKTTMVAPSLAYTPPSHPDAALLAACAEFDALERRHLSALRSCNTPAEERGAEPLIKRIREQQDAMLTTICGAPAVTREGMAAIAASITLWDLSLYFEEDDPGGYMNERLSMALLRSALAGGRA